MAVVEEETITLGETRGAEDVMLRWEAAGAGPLVLVLHGYPETRAACRVLLRGLAGVGYRALAPDCRGVGDSDAPIGVERYRPELLAADVAALVADQAPDGCANVVGHDWGGLQAWWAAMLHPELVSRLVVLNVAHPVVYATESRGFFYSMLTRAFEHPAILDAVSRMTDFAITRAVLRHDPVRPLSPELLEEYSRAWRRPKSTHTALAKDRAERRYAERTVQMARPVRCPVLTVWGDRDRYWDPSGAHPPQELAPDLRAEHLSAATHWVMHDEPDRVAELIASFCAETISPPGPSSPRGTAGRGR